jgi:hypothetical protein
LCPSVTLPDGWSPNDPESPEAQLLGKPEFTSPTSFSVSLPNGETRSFERDDVGRSR